MNDVGAGDVARHQVGSELNAAETQVHRLGERADHQRFGQARHTFEQAVAASQNGDQQLLDHFVLADDDLRQLGFHSTEGLDQFFSVLQIFVANRQLHGGRGRNHGHRHKQAGGMEGRGISADGRQQSGDALSKRTCRTLELDKGAEANNLSHLLQQKPQFQRRSRRRLTRKQFQFRITLPRGGRAGFFDSRCLVPVTLPPGIGIYTNISPLAL